MGNTVDIKPKNNLVVDIKPLNSQTIDVKPKGSIDDPFFNEYETVTSVREVGGWMGNPFLTYGEAGTVTIVQPKGGRAG